MSRREPGNATAPAAAPRAVEGLVLAVPSGRILAEVVPLLKRAMMSVHPSPFQSPNQEPVGCEAMYSSSSASARRDPRRSGVPSSKGRIG